MQVHEDAEETLAMKRRTFGSVSLAHHANAGHYRRKADASLDAAENCLRDESVPCAIRQLVEAASAIGEARAEIKGYGGNHQEELRPLVVRLWSVERRVRLGPPSRKARKAVDRLRGVRRRAGQR